MVQTPEEKAARRKARRQKRKEARANKAPTPSDAAAAPQDDPEEEVPVVQVQRPYSGFSGILFEKFTDEILDNPDSYRIYTEKLNLLGVIKFDHVDKIWWISGTRWPEDWDYSGVFPTIDAAMRVLYNHYMPMVLQDASPSRGKAHG